MESEAPAQTKPINWSLVIALAIFIVALGVRLIGIGWGLKNDLHNQSYHPDESTIFGFSRGIEPALGKFTPGKYNYGTFYLTALRIASDVTTAYSGGMPDTKNQDAYWSWVSRCIQAGRILTAFCGAGIALLGFLILKRWTSLFGATLGGSILALAPGLVVHSRFATVDIPATLLLVASAYQALRLLPADGEEPLAGKLRWRALIWAGVFAGLSAGTKYTGILALLTVFAVLALTKRNRNGLIEAAIATGCALLAFVISTPGVLLDSASFMRDFTYEMNHVKEGHGLVFIGVPSGFGMHLINLTVGLGFTLLIFSVVGAVWGSTKKQQWLWALAAFAIPYYIVIGRAEVSFLRYTFPLYLFLAAGAAFAFAEAHRMGGRFKLVVALGIIGLGGFPSGGLRSTAQTTYLISIEDPRDQAARYLKSKGDSVHVGLVLDPWYYTPPLYPNSTIGPLASWKARREMMAQSHPPITYLLTLDGGQTMWEPDLVLKARPEYVVFSSYEVDDVVRIQNMKGIGAGPEDSARKARIVLDELQKSYELDKTFGAPLEKLHDWLYIQPMEYVWRRKDVPKS